MSDDTLMQIATRYGTPTYVYDLARVRAQVASLRSAVPEAALRYAVKANANGAVLRTLAALDVGAEVITRGELERAHRAGIGAERIVLGGPGQDDDLIGRALELGVGTVSLDSDSQWRAWSGREGKTPRFLLRLNPGLDPRTHPHLATGAAESKFGLSPAQTEALAEELDGRGLLAGFHVHAGSMIRSLELYDEILDRLEPLYRRFPRARTLDLGGGFAVPDFPFEGFAAKVRAFRAAHGLDLLLEPGRFLVADAGVLLTRVRHVKDGARRHVIADAGMADLLRPALYAAEHPLRLVGRVGDTPTEADVDGPLCENADRLAQGRTLPELQRGDLLAVEQAGAYGMAMASNYASSLRPAEVVVDGGELRLVRERETVDDLLRLERE